MDVLKIGNIVKSDDSLLVEADVEVKGQRQRVYHKTANCVLADSVESFIALALLPCMKQGWDCAAPGEVSPRVLSVLDTIQDIYCIWDARFSRMRIRDAVPHRREWPNARRVGTFFSGGLDSFYTLLKHVDEITDIIFIHGIDVALDNVVLRQRTSEVARNVAASLGKRAVEIETNMRALLNPYVPWRLANGIGLAIVGQTLAAEFERIYIPSTHTYADLFPWGSHPVLDPLWSTETLEFVHDGCEATRVRKAALVATSDVAMQSLRVCWENADGAYNCGRCEKCLRTMINLHVVGALERCTTFDRRIDPRLVARVWVRGDNLGTLAFVRENIRALEEQRLDPELRDALRTILEPGVMKRTVAAMGRLRARAARRRSRTRGGSGGASTAV